MANKEVTLLDFIITLLFGIFGVHKFRAGNKTMGLVYLFTFGLFFIGYFVDVLVTWQDYRRGKIKPVNKAVTRNTASSVSRRKTPAELLQWQKLLVVNSPNRLIMTEAELENCTDSYISNEYRIVNDCRHLIANTVKPDVFFSRLDLLDETLTHLSVFEPYFSGFYGKLPSEIHREIFYKEQEMTNRFLKRYYITVYEKAEEMKTQKGKDNQFKKFYESLQPYFDRMDERNIKYIENKAQTHSIYTE